MHQTGSQRARAEGSKRQPPAERANLYDEVTGRIVSELEAGRFPWVQPWGRPNGQGFSAAPGLPRNGLTSRNYSGVNVLILWGAVIENGYPSQSWLTFRQALEAGGNVRKGERGTRVVYADRFTPEAEKERARQTGGEARAVPFLKRFTVFNVAQCEGLRPGLATDPAPLPERQVVPIAEAVIAASGVDFRIGGDKAYYVPSADYVQVPPQPAFTGRPTLLVLDEAWVFLDHPLFAARIREWLKVLRKKNVSVVFATQSLADIADSTIAPAIIESCPQRILLPNDRAIEPQGQTVYVRFGLNARQIELVSRATPKRQYYLQSARGNRLFELGLGPIALALCGASDPDSQKRIDAVLAEKGQADFAATFLSQAGLDWAADLLGRHPAARPPEDKE